MCFEPILFLSCPPPENLLQGFDVAVQLTAPAGVPMPGIHSKSLTLLRNRCARGSIFSDSLLNSLPAGNSGMLKLWRAGQVVFAFWFFGICRVSGRERAALRARDNQGLKELPPAVPTGVPAGRSPG
jgi:hypothetical protein